jgi:hypothetical protein
MEKRATVGVAVVGVLGVLLVLAGTAFHFVPKEVAIFGGLACWFIASMIRRRANKPVGGKAERRQDDQDQDTAGDSG